MKAIYNIVKCMVICCSLIINVQAANILSVDIGDSPYGISYRCLRSNREVVPEAFCIDDKGIIYILENATRQIKYYKDNDYIGKIDIGEVQYARDMVCYDNNIYLLDAEQQAIHNVKLQDHTLKTVFLLEQLKGCELIGISIDYDTQAIVIQQRDKLYSIPITQIQSLSSGDEIMLGAPIGALEKERLLGIVNQKYIVEGYQLNNMPICNGNMYIYSQDDTHKVVKSMCIALDQVYYLSPYKLVTCNEEGTIYQMVTGKERLEVIKRKWNQPGFLGKDYKIKCTESDNSSLFEGFDTLVYQDAVYSREESELRAVAMSEFSWYLQNKYIVYDTEAVVLPSYLLQGKRQQAMNGIPYCWGGFNGISSTSKVSFERALSNGASAGNVKCEGDWKSNTAGLDCSGYVACAVGFKEKLNTSDLSDLSYTYPIWQDQCLPYDIYVKPRDHVIFYIEEVAHGIITREATTSGEEKVKVYFRPYSWLMNHQYTLRRFYNF